MVIKYTIPASIEGKSIQLKGLEIKPLKCIRETQKGMKVYPFTVKRKGQALIKEELDPKEYSFKDYSFLNKGDGIEGINIWGFSLKPFTPDDISIGGLAKSSTHSGQYIIIKGFICFAELITDNKKNSLKKHPQDELL